MAELPPEGGGRPAGRLRRAGQRLELEATSTQPLPRWVAIGCWSLILAVAGLAAFGLWELVSGGGR